MQISEYKITMCLKLFFIPFLLIICVMEHCVFLFIEMVRGSVSVWLYLGHLFLSSLIVSIALGHIEHGLLCRGRILRRAAGELNKKIKGNYGR